MSGARKGYGRSKLPREELARRKPEATFVHGVFGTVPKLYDVIDAALREKGWNWSTLGNQCGFTRTYVVKLTEQQAIPYTTLVQLLSPLGLNADELIVPLPDEADESKATT